MSRFVFFVTLLLAAVLTLGCSQPNYKNISNEELQTLLDQGVTLIDIRRPEEWRQTGIVEQSHTITLFDASGRIDRSFLTKLASAAPNKADPIALICRTGNRTQAGADMLANQLGYSQVHNVRNGITSWISEGRAVVRALSPS